MNKKFMIVLIFLFSSMMLFALGGRDNEKPHDASSDKADVVKITGVVRLTGTAHFPEIVISADDCEWFVVKDEAGIFFEMQYQIVTIEAEESVKELRFANGISAGVRRELRNIRILSVER